MTKSIPAIVEQAFDAELLSDRIIVAVNDLNSIESRIIRIEGQLEDARGTAKTRRLEIGQMLLEARAAWPERGPRAKGWGEFLLRVNMDDSTAWRYIELAKTGTHHGLTNDERPDPPTPRDHANDFSHAANLRENSPPAEPEKRVNGNGGSGEMIRGEYCTPEKYARAVGGWDLDPFSNERSHIEAVASCALERGDDGLLDLAQPGSYFIASEGQCVADWSTRVWLQPPYEIAADAVAHYGHTRFCALLRFDPSTEWFARLWQRTQVIAVPLGERIEFEAPDGIETSANPYPHAFYFAREEDVTDELRALCIVLRVDHEPQPEVVLDQEGGEMSLDDEPA